MTTVNMMLEVDEGVPLATGRGECVDLISAATWSVVSPWPQRDYSFTDGASYPAGVTAETVMRRRASRSDRGSGNTVNEVRFILDT